ncbi:TetR/AcrR family transcriptional regulator [Haloplanus halophilus]|uniref:TetR/AcrR family transcriptional regulator n=1 Tax=Haloplanus halophilus TaxID=2949993 RepID=UPI00203F6593|nr:TetR/AcrR family transcriptional regulator [Haloplanus sp. GDY1]
MAFEPPFDAAPADTRAAIMRATYEALIEHGYENLTIQRIGDEFPKSKSLIYQHYDGKDEVLVALLEFLLDHLKSQMPQPTTEDADDCLRTVLDFVLAPDRDAERAELTDVMVELRGQSPHNRVFREYFSANDRTFRRDLAAIVDRGIDEGVYRPVDPDVVAEFVLTVMSGATVRRATTDEAVDVADVRRELDAYLEARVLR